MDDAAKLPLQFGRFKLVRRIGAGGMGEVFLAREELGPHSRACVVKKVLPSLIENRQFVGRFLDEAKVVVRLSHPNIARVYSMGDVAGEYYLAMEYVQGKTVSRFMHRLRQLKQVLPLGLILLIGERVCDGLAYAHDATDENGSPLHLVHRDLSPANVCVSYRGEVKIIDFGASTSTLKEEQTAPRVVIGNLTYMAPEQARKKIVDRRADVYATGVVLWELLAWKALPQKGDPLERWRKAANPNWEPPSAGRPDLPAELDDIILKAVRKEPGDRFASAAALGDALRTARRKYAPEANEGALAALMTQAFAKEKQAEDEALAEVGAPPISSRTQDIALTQIERAVVVPPTALAFEHRAVAAGPLDLVTEPGEAAPPAPPTDTSPDEISEVRAVFLETSGSAEPKLVKEIEPDEDEVEEPDTSRFDPKGRRRMVVLGMGVFLGASALGFFAIWLLLVTR